MITTSHRRRAGSRSIVALSGLGIAALLLAGCSNPSDSSKSGDTGAAPSGTVIAYNSPDAWANFKQVRADFLKKTGITVPQDTKNSGQALAALQAEASNPQADVAYWGITYGLDAQKANLITPYKPAHFGDIDPSLVEKNGYWTSIHYGSIAFLVNTTALGSKPVPKTWTDLLNPTYKGMVFYADPNAAAIGYYTAAAINAAFGGTPTNWTPALDYLKKLSANGAVHPNNTTPSKIASGEYAILIDADFNGYIQKYDNNAPVETVIPTEGTVRVPYAVALVKGGPNPTAAKAWIDFLLSDTGQQDFAKAYIHPVRGEIPADIQKKMVPEAQYKAATKTVDFAALATVHDAFIKLYQDQIK
jgi:putative spermidine/putrescine transport system substrate-binding protein